jgi:polyisoprenoid-binding protein YceI
MLKKFQLLAAMLGIFTLAAAAAAPTNYSADVNHSNVGFAVPILDGISHVSGKFSSFSVNIAYDEADVTKSTVSANIKAASIDTGVEGRDKHLRSADFFDVEKYPEITFQSKRVQKKGKSFLATGDFTMHGVTKEIVIPFTATGKFLNEKNKQTSLGFQARVSLNRRDYGMTYSNPAVPNFVGDVVSVDLAILVRTAAAK